MPALEEVPTLRSRALSQYVLKVHSRCNLACDHCYMYEHADQSWRGRPRLMSVDTVRAAAMRIAEHAAAHRLDRVHVVLHGGEPLLLGVALLRDALARLRAAIEPVTSLDLRIQTNGVLLTPTMCDLLADNDVKVGVSLDGDLQANDRHRRFADGGSSHTAVLRGLTLLRSPAYRRIYAGILCTVDIANDPVAVYEALVSERPPHVDLLLPHATWDRPPPGSAHDPTPYATWLGRIWQRWMADGQPMPIRLFTSLMSTAVGGHSGTETVGLEPVDLVVVETDGSWEQVDSLKTAFDGAPATGYDVFSHTVDEVATHPGIVERQGGLADLCATCRACPVVRQCGGGLFAHRYRSANGFDNPSVYCTDLKELIVAMNSSPLRLVTGVREPDEGGSATAAVPAGQADADFALLDEIAAGYGDAATVDEVVAAQLSITRTLLVAVGQPGRVVDAGSGRLAADAWQLLLRLDDEAPDAVHRVLTHPFVRTWAFNLLNSDPPVDPERLGYLGCLAAAAAVHAGVSVDVDVPISDSTVHLPTLGALALGSPVAGTAVLSTRPGGFTVRVNGKSTTVDLDHGRSVPAWQSGRLISSDGLAILIEDTDPNRDCHDWPAAARLPAAAAQDFGSSVLEAWRLIRRDVPEHEPGIRGALRAIVPLRTDSTGRLRSATARQAFGAMATTAAAAEEMAVLIVHELQHLKLGALLDLHHLFDPTRTTRLTVAWRPDLRPVEGVLQGTYAHLGVAGIWRARAFGRAAGPDDDRRAEAAKHFQRYRDWTVDAIDRLGGSGALTAAGARFVSRMQATIDGWPGG